MSSKPDFVGLVVGDELDRRLRSGERRARARRDRRIEISSVLPMLKTWPMAFGSPTSFEQRADDVGDVLNAPRLRAVAEHRDRLAGERLPHEVRDHHAVLARLARADGVEEAHDDHRQLAFLPVGEREELVDGLAARVRPAVLRRRARSRDRASSRNGTSLLLP